MASILKFTGLRTRNNDDEAPKAPKPASRKSVEARAQEERAKLKELLPPEAVYEGPKPEDVLKETRSLLFTLRGGETKKKDTGAAVHRHGLPAILQKAFAAAARRAQQEGSDEGEKGGHSSSDEDDGGGAGGRARARQRAAHSMDAAGLQRGVVWGEEEGAEEGEAEGDAGATVRRKVRRGSLMSVSFTTKLPVTRDALLQELKEKEAAAAAAADDALEEGALNAAMAAEQRRRMERAWAGTKHGVSQTYLSAINHAAAAMHSPGAPTNIAHLPHAPSSAPDVTALPEAAVATALARTGSAAAAELAAHMDAVLPLGAAAGALSALPAHLAPHPPPTPSGSSSQGRSFLSHSCSRNVTEGGGLEAQDSQGGDAPASCPNITVTSPTAGAGVFHGEAGCPLSPLARVHQARSFHGIPSRSISKGRLVPTALGGPGSGSSGGGALGSGASGTASPVPAFGRRSLHVIPPDGGSAHGGMVSGDGSSWHGALSKTLSGSSGAGSPVALSASPSMATGLYDASAGAVAGAGVGGPGGLASVVPRLLSPSSSLQQRRPSLLSLRTSIDLPQTSAGSASFGRSHLAPAGSTDGGTPLSPQHSFPEFQQPGGPAARLMGTPNLNARRGASLDTRSPWVPVTASSWDASQASAGQQAPRQGPELSSLAAVAAASSLYHTSSSPHPPPVPFGAPEGAPGPSPRLSPSPSPNSPLQLPPWAQQGSQDPGTTLSSSSNVNLAAGLLSSDGLAAAAGSNTGSVACNKGRLQHLLASSKPGLAGFEEANAGGEGDPLAPFNSKTVVAGQHCLMPTCRQGTTEPLPGTAVSGPYCPHPMYGRRAVTPLPPGEGPPAQHSAPQASTWHVSGAGNGAAEPAAGAFDLGSCQALPDDAPACPMGAGDALDSLVSQTLGGTNGGGGGGAGGGGGGGGGSGSSGCPSPLSRKNTRKVASSMGLPCAAAAAATAPAAPPNPLYMTPQQRAALHNRKPMCANLSCSRLEVGSGGGTGAGSGSGSGADSGAVPAVPWPYAASAGGGPEARATTPQVPSTPAQGRRRGAAAVTGPGSCDSVAGYAASSASSSTGEGFRAGHSPLYLSEAGALAARAGLVNHKAVLGQRTPHEQAAADIGEILGGAWARNKAAAHAKAQEKEKLGGPAGGRGRRSSLAIP